MEKLTTVMAKILLNSVYGKYPERHPHWVQEVFDEALKNGLIKTRLTESQLYTKEEVDKILKQPVLTPDYCIQNQLYAALMKGENNMNEVMKDIAVYGKPAYLATENGLVPVRIDTYTTSPFECDRFEGHVLSPAESCVRSSIKRKSGSSPWGKLPEIKSVHFSGPVTVVIWADGTKTLVRKGENDEIDYEKGLAMAIAKKALGTNKSGSNYYDIFKKYLPKPEGDAE